MSGDRAKAAGEIKAMLEFLKKEDARWGRENSVELFRRAQGPYLGAIAALEWVLGCYDGDFKQDMASGSFNYDRFRHGI